MRRRVGICSFEIDGPKRGGIGTAYASLAEVLAAAGHDVTLVFAGDRCEQGSLPEWQAHFARRGIRFEALPPLAETVGPVEAIWQVQLSYRAYRHLKARAFDVIHFPEVLGVGYFSLLAFQQGLAFQGTTLCVGAHGSSPWVREANGTGPLQPPMWAATQDFLERRSVELAPVVVSPSAYMLRWMEARGWALPAERRVLQNVLRPATGVAAAAPRAAEELVFFGRLEARKGVVLFCEAVERLIAAGGAPPRVTFLGWPAKDPIEGRPAADWIRARSARWPRPARVVSDLDPAGALAYLREPGRLAVMPSPSAENSPYTVLECLAAGVPFVTTDVGGIPELVAADDRAAACVAPTAEALAQRLADARREARPVPRPAVTPDAGRDAWLAWHAAARANPPVVPPHEPLVSVCVEGAASLAPQDYPAVETLRLDDRSPGARRRAVAAARGEYVAFVSPGASLVPGALRTFVTAARHGRADGLTAFSRTGEALGLFTAGPASAGLAGNVFGDAHAFFRREALLRIAGPDDGEGRSPDDRVTLARAALQGLRLDVVPEVLLEHPAERPRHTALPEALAAAYREALPEALRDLPEAVQALAASSRAGAIARATAREMREAPGGALLLGSSTANLADATESAAFVRAVQRSPAWQALGPLRALALVWRRIFGTRP